jgi:hypothetical protein
MTEFDHASPSVPSAAPAEPSLSAQFQALRSQVTAMLILLLVLSGSVNVFILRQLILLGRQSKELSLIVNDYEKTKRPIMENFTDRLRDYSKTHRDFLPILSKYYALPEPAASNPPTVKPTPKK